MTNPRWSLALLTLLLPAAAQTLDPLVVTATRAPRPLSDLPVTVDVFDQAQLRASAASTVDDALKASAAFSLFRRTGSLSANPTAQGVSLRNLGPNGAGRTLVLVDGIPLNDPFGGWVAWSKAPRLTLARAEIVRGGGSSAWGSAALGGTIQLFSQGPTSATDESHEQFQFEVGDFGTRTAELASVTSRNQDTFTVNARGFHSDGFARTAPAFAGSLDRPTDLEQGSVQLAWTRTTDSGTRGTITARAFSEARGNGTPLQRNRTREALVSAAATGQRDLFGQAVDWTATTYAQTQEFSNLFTTVNDDRSSEAPVLDQFAVPADAAGAATTATWSTDAGTTTLGADARWAQGETGERYFVQNGEFSRERHAGGTQSFAGIFAHHDKALSSVLRGSASARLDVWSLTDGYRRETDRTNGASVRDDSFADRSGTEFSPRLGLVWKMSDQWRLQTAAYQAFRVPTLNELYRPFRVGSTITEANPDLKVESLRGAEIGANWTGAKGSFRVTAFSNDLDDAVANVTLGAGPGIVPGVGFVPAGGLGRRRENLDRVRVQGLEISASWQPEPSVTLRLDYLYSDATDTATQDTLPQVPSHTFVTGLAWQPTAAWQFNLQARYISDAFEDDLNTLVLDAATTLDLRVAHQFSPTTELFAAVENLFDQEVVTNRSASGSYDLGTPRFTRAGVRWAW
jgi:outer membrane receptor protein involved in Fe transport